MADERIRPLIVSLKKRFEDFPEKALVVDSFARARLGDSLSVTVEGPSGQRLTSDMPKGIGGGAAAPSPGWIARAGIAACATTTIALRAAELSIPITSVEVKVESRSNDAAFLGVGVPMPPGPIEVTMHVEIRSTASKESVEALVTWALEHAPEVDALTRAIPMRVTTHVAPV